jgi:formylglycine-generating enzyme required for sulfatase activity
MGVCRERIFQDVEVDHPVVRISWQDALDYCTWVNTRLPSEAEWEKAAKGEENQTYPWGDTGACEFGNFSGCVGSSSAVGSYPEGKSVYGALDMSGNVWEWVADWYDAAYYEISPQENPAGPGNGSSRVLRGGSWYFDQFFARVSNRHYDYPFTTSFNYGFRCASSP